MKAKISEDRSITELLDDIETKIEDLDAIFKIVFEIPLFSSNLTLFSKFKSPVKSREDLNIRLLQFGLLIDSISKKKIDEVIISKDSSKEQLQQLYNERCSFLNNESHRVDLLKSLFPEIKEKELIIVIQREPGTIDSLMILLENTIPNFDKGIIVSLRKLRQLRNISEYAHEVGSMQIDKVLQSYGFSYPLKDTDIAEFWKRTMSLFFDVLQKLISEIQGHRTKLYTENILKFSSEFGKTKIKYGEKTNINFSFHRNHKNNILFRYYKISFYFNDELRVNGGWHKFSFETEFDNKVIKNWGMVDPTTYYGLNKKGKWTMHTEIEFNLEGESFSRTVEAESQIEIS